MDGSFVLGARMGDNLLGWFQRKVQQSMDTIFVVVVKVTETERIEIVELRFTSSIIRGRIKSKMSASAAHTKAFW